MAEPDKKPQFSISMTPAELARLDDWAFSNRIRARAEAVRRLVELGLAASAAGWTPEAPAAKKAPKKAPKKATAKKGQA